ncbi:MAG: aminotransferase class I/II-fold pyridoxal phosphate-dependent enzyme [Nanoarchaeota archaeon]
MSERDGREDVLKAIREVFEKDTWWMYTNDSVREFERRFARAHDCAHGVSVCNGTVAVDVVLRALGVGPGDKVLLPAFNFYSLPKSVENVGATPVFVDVNADNPTISAEEARAAIDPAVKAVVAVHIAGAVAELDKLSDICRDANVALVEDCAQATGAEYGGKHVGSWGVASVFSFGGVKLMTSGQGGMVTTSDPDIYEKVFAIVHRGSSPSGGVNRFGIVGDNYMMSVLAAATLQPQLDLLPAMCEKRELMMRFLDREIKKIDGLHPLRQFGPVRSRTQMRYAFSCKRGGANGEGTTEFVRIAKEKGVPLDARFYRTVTNDERLFRKYSAKRAFPMAKRAEDEIVGIWHWDVMKGVEYWSKALEYLHQAA